MNWSLDARGVWVWLDKSRARKNMVKRGSSGPLYGETIISCRDRFTRQVLMESASHGNHSEYVAYEDT